jgi:hypothetical protein
MGFIPMIGRPIAVTTHPKWGALSIGKIVLRALEWDWGRAKFSIFVGKSGGNKYFALEILKPSEDDRRGPDPRGDGVEKNSKIGTL